MVMFTIMIFLFFFFVGILGMFWYQGNRVAQRLQELSEEHAQLRVLLRAVESRMDGVAALEKARDRTDSGEMPQKGVSREMSPAHDPLLHLSFDQTRENVHSDLNLDKPLKLD